MNKKYNYPRTVVNISDEAKKAVNRVLESGSYIKGKENEHLSKEFADFCGAKAGVPVSSGSMALFVALKMLDLQPGDEVITVPNTFIATVNAILLAGGRPKFVDINQDTFNMDPSELKKVITEKTKVIVPVHLYGLLAPMDEILDIANANNIAVIEDACQSHGASLHGKKSGSWGEFGVFSFYPTKVLNTAGDGGFVTTNNPAQVQRLNQIINHGRKSQYEYDSFGFNFRLSEIQAAVVREHLKVIDKEITRRNEIASYYTKKLKDIKQVKTPSIPDDAVHAYYLYTIKVENRDALREHLNSLGIGSSIEYPVLLNNLEFIKKNLVNPDTKFPNAEYCLESMISLPMYSDLSVEDLDNIISEIKSFYEN